MQLRAKILVVVAALMAILYILVAGSLLPELVAGHLKLQRDLSKASARAIVSYLDSLTQAERLEALAQPLHPVFTQGQLGAWAVCDDRLEVLAWSLTERPPQRPDPELLERQGLDMQYNLALLPGQARPLFLYVSPSPAVVSVGRELWSIFVAMLIGTLLMGAVLYFLLLRLVILPLERLAAASRVAAGSRKVLPRVPHTDRGDEVGALVRNFNGMVDEVNDLRTNLEGRVAKAVKELEGANRQLVLSERLSTTGRLAAGVAHEINNPLGGMLNAARSLQSRGAEGTREREYAALIVEGLGRIQGIVSTMLRFARPTRAQTEVDLPAVLRDALLFCQHRLQDPPIELVTELPEPGTPGGWTVVGDRAGLGQVFLNILMNAIDALQEKSEGPRRLEVRLLRQDGALRAVVADSGVGMSPEVQRQSREPFFTTKPEGKGTGLGLAIAAHIIEGHGGRLEIESSPGQGTRLRITLPEGGRSGEAGKAGAAEGGPP